MLAALASLLAACALQQADAEPADEIRVHYDRLGIPHVFAASDEDVFYGLGLTQARDFPVATLVNLWSMTGRFAEVAGKSVLARDERVRALGIDRLAAAQAAEDMLDADVRRFLEAYVAGVEAGRRWWLADPARLDVLAGKNGEEMCVDPVPVWLHPALARGEQRARLGRLFELEISLEHVLALGIGVNAGTEFAGMGYGTGTNVWLVRNGAGEESVLSCIDRHQPLKNLGIRSYLVQLSGPSYRVTGSPMMPGLPCILAGFSDDFTFGVASRPKVPVELAGKAVPFRPVEATPVVETAWRARLEPDLPLRFAMEDGSVVALEERRETLRYFDAERGELVPDPRGERAWYRVPETVGPAAELGIIHPVIDPAPGTALLPGAEIRFEGKPWLSGRSAWEFWIQVARAERVGGSSGANGSGEASGPIGADVALARSTLSFGRGELFTAADSAGGLELVWLSRVPVPGPGALEDGVPRAGVLDGHDPEQRWRGFHALGDLPRALDSAGFGEEPAVWVNCNDSPEFIADGDAYAFGGPRNVYDGTPFKSRRHDRSRELLEAALRDGPLTLDALERIALDVQDPWSRAFWPLLSALRDAPEADGAPSLAARAFLDWVERFRREGPDGRPGEEEFLAHPLSQVTPFLALLRDRFERSVLALADPTLAEITFTFDATLPLPAPEEFRAGETWRRVRLALAEALESTAALHAATLAREDGGLANREFFGTLGRRLKRCGSLAGDPWSDPRFRTQPADWGADAPPAALRWGEVHVYALTAHQVPGEPRGEKRRSIVEWLRSMFLPCDTADPSPYHRAQVPLVFPIGGARDTVFQLHRAGLDSLDEALFTTPIPLGASEGAESARLLIAPVDFGSQLLTAVELRPGKAARARVLAALAGTEITTAIPELGLERNACFAPALDFAAGRWSELVLDEETLAETPGVRTLRFRRQ